MELLFEGSIFLWVLTKEILVLHDSRVIQVTAHPEFFVHLTKLGMVHWFVVVDFQLLVNTSYFLFVLACAQWASEDLSLATTANLFLLVDFKFISLLLWQHVLRLWAVEFTLDRVIRLNILKFHWQFWYQLIPLLHCLRKVSSNCEGSIHIWCFDIQALSLGFITTRDAFTLMVEGRVWIRVLFWFLSF